MYWFPAAHDTTTTKLPAFRQRFQSEERILKLKAFKLFRILVILWGLSATFWDMASLINQSLVSLFQAQADYTCWNDSSFKFWYEFYIKRTLFLSSKTFSVVIMMFYWLLAIKKK